MKLNNKGFALTSIIYMLIVLFLMVMLLILANLAQRKVVLDKIKSEVKENLNQGGLIAKNTYTVTFDPTIGQINQTTKQVTYGEPYGELPTPTREGYEFAGWRGKNLFDPNNVVLGYIDDADGVLKDKQSGRNSSKYIEIKADTDYKITPMLSSGNWGAFYDEEKNFISGFKYYNRDVHSPSNAKYLRFTINYQNSNANYATTTQLEEGNTATSYEPYQEYTSDTIVTKQENHTLYAMWKPIYTVTFDPNGGTLSEPTKQVTYGDPYGELPTPTREGYTFLGWNGKNLIDLEKSTIKNGILNNDYSIRSNISDSYYTSIGIEYLNDYIINNKGKKLTFSMNEIISGYNMTIVIYGSRSSGGTFQEINSIDRKVSLTIPDDFTSVTKIELRFNRSGSPKNDTTTTRTNFQLELGDIATEYEPYYITSDTKVVQNQNHTLTAIWQANE